MGPHVILMGLGPSYGGGGGGEEGTEKGLSAKSWKVLKMCSYDNSRKAGDKHRYALGDILREAASRFATIAALEKRVLRLALTTANREKKMRLMGERHVQVAVDSHIRAYIWEGTGTSAEIYLGKEARKRRRGCWGGGTCV